jgi:hypothetical protein
MRVRVARLVCQRLARILGAVGKAAVLTRHHAEVVVRVGVAGLDAQYLCVARGRFGNGTAPMQREPFLQQVVGC